MHFVTTVPGSSQEAEANQTYEKHNRPTSDELDKRNGGGKRGKKRPIHDLLPANQTTLLPKILRRRTLRERVTKEVV